MLILTGDGKRFLKKYDGKLGKIILAKDDNPSISSLLI